MSNRSFECISCKAEVEVAAFLTGLAGFLPQARTAAAKCPACGEPIEFEVRSGSLELGYTYWAGSMHFEGLVTVHVPGIKVVGDGDSRAIEAGGVVYRPRSE